MLKHSTNIRLLGALILTLVSTGALAQRSSLTTFSPYTLYGLGDMAVGGSAFNRPMAGVGLGARSATSYNYLNPASLSAVRQHSALFTIGGEQQNYYSKTATSSTSFNTANLHDLGFAFPLAKGIGMGFSLTPVSSVGYSSRIIDDNPDIVENLGSVVYDYAGEGGISQVAMGIGAVLAKGLSAGINFQYWFGAIDRRFNAQPYSVLSSDVYHGIFSQAAQNYSAMLFSFGAQYTFALNDHSVMTLGATYQPAKTTSVRNRLEVMNVLNTQIDTVGFEKFHKDMRIPSKVAAGLFYQTSKWNVGLDYNRQDWEGAFDVVLEDHITLRAQEEYRLGASFTPNRYDIRKALNRWTYKVGVRYGTSYLEKDGYTMHDAAVSLGFDFALKRNSASRFGFGVEGGRRGTPTQGQIQESYLRFFIALGFLGEDYWFVRQKYQ